MSVPPTGRSCSCAGTASRTSSSNTTASTGALVRAQRAVVGAAALAEPAAARVDCERRRQHERRDGDALEPERRAGRVQDAARARHQLLRIAVVVGPFEIEVVAQQREQDAHAARPQRREQRERRRLAADADEGRDRPVAERRRRARRAPRRGARARPRPARPGAPAASRRSSALASLEDIARSLARAAEAPRLRWCTDAGAPPRPHVRRRPARAAPVAHPLARRCRDAHAADAPDRARDPRRLGQHGHRHDRADGDRPGAARRHRRPAPLPLGRGRGRRGRAREALPHARDRRSAHHRGGRDARSARAPRSSGWASPACSSWTATAGSPASSRRATCVPATIPRQRWPSR